MKTMMIKDSDLDKSIELHFQLAELLFLDSLLADVSTGVIPDNQFDEKHIMLWKQFSKYIHSCVMELLEDDKKD